LASSDRLEFAQNDLWQKSSKVGLFSQWFQKVTGVKFAPRIGLENIIAAKVQEACQRPIEGVDIRLWTVVQILRAFSPNLMEPNIPVG